MFFHDIRPAVRSLRLAPASALLAVMTIARGVTANTAIFSMPPAPPIDSVIVSADWLAHHISDPRTIVLDVVHTETAFSLGHIPGARFVTYDAITTSRNGLNTELPEPAALRRIFADAGVSDDSRVILYSDDPLMASRAFFSLEYLGQRHAAILNGGVAAWLAVGGRLARGNSGTNRGRITTPERPELIADAEWVRAHLNAPHVALVDTRTDGEYLGSGERHGMPSQGHIPGARQLRWQELFADPGTGLFQSVAQLAKQFERRANRGDTVVTYCYVGYRASMTYLVARALGYEAKLYDGSYQDWAERSLPTASGSRP